MSVHFIQRQAKQAAKVLPNFLGQHAPPFSHTQCLELVAQLHGFPNFHAARTSESRLAQEATSTTADSQGAIPGPWWCDQCGEIIRDVRDGYLVFQDRGHKASDFLIIHKSRCDPHGAYGSSIALNDLVGGLGLAKLLSFLAVGPLLKPDSETITHRLRDLEEFVDLVRRVQTPGYERARRYFSDPLWHGRLSEWNEYAPYTPGRLEAMLTWDVSAPLDGALHVALCGERFSGTAKIEWSESEESIDVVAAFAAAQLELTTEDDETWTFALCADGKFRCELTDENGSPDGVVELELVKVSPKKITIRGLWKDGHETGDVSILLSSEAN